MIYPEKTSNNFNNNKNYEISDSHNSQIILGMVIMRNYHPVHQQ